MNRQAFIEYVQNLRGATFVTAYLETKYRMNKNGLVNGVKQPNPYYDKVIKKQTINGTINFDYTASVNRLRDKLSGDEPGTSQFKAGKHPWSTEASPISKTQHNNAIIEKDGKYSMQIKIEHILSSELFYNGKPIDKKTLAAFAPPPKAYSNEPSEAKINIIAPGLDNIKKVVFKKEAHVFENLKKLIKNIINEQKTMTPALAISDAMEELKIYGDPKYKTNTKIIKNLAAKKLSNCHKLDLNKAKTIISGHMSGEQTDWEKKLYNK